VVQVYVGRVSGCFWVLLGGVGVVMVVPVPVPVVVCVVRLWADWDNEAIKAIPAEV
jgi:hypothetical protein